MLQRRFNCSCFNAEKPGPRNRELHIGCNFIGRVRHTNDGLGVIRDGSAVVWEAHIYLNGAVVSSPSIKGGQIRGCDQRSTAKLAGRTDQLVIPLSKQQPPVF